MGKYAQPTFLYDYKEAIANCYATSDEYYLAKKYELTYLPAEEFRQMLENGQFELNGGELGEVVVTGGSGNNEVSWKDEDGNTQTGTKDDYAKTKGLQ